jgi:mevalonate kinase
VAICDPDRCNEIATAIGRSFGDSFITRPTAEGVKLE